MSLRKGEGEVGAGKGKAHPRRHTEQFWGERSGTPVPDAEATAGVSF